LSDDARSAAVELLDALDAGSHARHRQGGLRATAPKPEVELRIQPVL
jgi:hypothetical protein